MLSHICPALYQVLAPLPHIFLSHGSRVLTIVESTISLVLGAAILTILVPLFLVFAIDFLAYVSSMALQMLSKKLAGFTDPSSDLVAATSGTLVSTSLVVKFNSSGTVKDFFLRVSLANYVPPMAGIWLKLTEEEH